ncbi:bifunctional 2-polyprenyl-6-hydroxyphenol methylase/3-demethylubiquinol 3-O-methyltransferase UbiG [Amycolatopsis sp. GM8]|uniref:class I SAM-dependent methyltransferase n=1 Tax=Amycolatopsis sp. GM8 TaxID=2896530 RepID=UPI001F4661B1|nr:class I SAM-dependent methyltransferase [Amycolatopsis sp. GM8]
MTNQASVAGAWDLYSTKHRDKRFTWGGRRTLGRSPGMKVLNPRAGQRALELGCGSGDNAAHVAALGACVTAIDMSPVQVAAARDLWGHLPNLTVEQAEAVAFLDDDDGQQFDAVYSVYGAAWYTDPELLLPAVKARVAPGGVYVFSHAHAPETGRGTLDSCPSVERWDFHPHTWVFLLRTHGFRQIETWELPASKGFPDWPTMLVRGRIDND